LSGSIERRDVAAANEALAAVLRRISADLAARTARGTKCYQGSRTRQRGMSRTALKA
jgi:hypothetical protein